MSWNGLISDRRLSLITCDNLDPYYGLDHRNDVKITKKMGEYLEEYFRKSKTRVGGGMAECSVVDGSDSDIMGIIDGFVVVDNDSENNNDCIPIKAVRTGCFPGYCKLKLTSQLNRYNFIITKSLRGIYISSKLLCENCIPTDLVCNREGHVEISFNGPAITNYNVDYVRSFEMYSWPIEAKLWKSRKRTNNWPGYILLDRLEKEIPCYVVPIGNKKSPEFELEWRLSFVELERELIWSLNDIQFKCYVILKIVKKKLFSEIAILKDITTYHLKNIIFWMCEKLPERDWSKTKLIHCVNKCLNMLEACIKKKTLEHYFIPENNLFRDIEFKVGSSEKEFHKLKTCIKMMLSVISNESMSHVPMPIVTYSCRFENIWTYCSIYSDPQFADSLVKTFPEAYLLLPCVTIIQAVTKWQERLVAFSQGELKRNGNTDDSLIESVVQKINEGRNMDFSQSTIHIALVYFMHGLYHKAIAELEPLFSDKSKKVFLSCLGEPKYLCFNTGEMSNLNAKATNVNVHDLKERNKIVYQFISEYHNSYILPYPLALQVLNSSSRDSFRYNPVIVSYYLLCMSYLKLFQQDKFNDTLRVKFYDALTRFEKAVMYNKGRKDFYMSLVLLGHCLYWSGNTKNAYFCFVRSINVKPSVLNAAVYHLAFLINECVQRERL